MIKISAIIITKNSETIIADCLDSVSFCDEILVVDNNSNDRTRDIVKKMKAKVFEYLSRDFSEIRNFGLKKALGEWVLYVDADERVTKELKKNIEDRINMKNNYVSAYKIMRKNFYFGNHEWPYVEHLERLFKKNSLGGWHGQLHESPKFKGEIEELDGYLLHYSHRNLSDMLLKTIEWSKIEAELRYNAGHPKMIWWRFPRVMITEFLKFYVRQGGWKVGVIGLIESMYQSFSIFVTYARLWEMQQEKK